MHLHKRHSATCSLEDSWRVMVVDQCDVFDYAAADGADVSNAPEPECSPCSPSGTAHRVLGSSCDKVLLCNSGFSSSRGHRKYMEDRAFMAQGLCKLGGGEYQQEHVHVFGVCDGHGGSLVAEYCAQHIPHQLSQLLHKPEPSTTHSEHPTDTTISTHKAAHVIRHQPPAPAPPAAFDHTPPYPASPTADSSPEAAPELWQGYSVDAAIQSAIVEAYHTVDQGIKEEGCELSTKAQLMGTTAITAVVAEQHIWVANCGDSRAVLGCNGEARPLSQDHKACCIREAARVRNAGGLIVHNFGGPRVMGILAVTRALGDHALRPFGVTSTPEVTRYTRSKSDQFLILASDGLWDALSDQYAVELVSTVFSRVNKKNSGGSLHMLAPRIAARVLTRVALSRGSQDNITVVVVDLRQPTSLDQQDKGALQEGACEMSDCSPRGCGDEGAGGKTEAHPCTHTQAPRAPGDTHLEVSGAGCGCATGAAAAAAAAAEGTWQMESCCSCPQSPSAREECRKRVLADETNCQRRGKSPRLQMGGELKLMQPATVPSVAPTQVPVLT